MDNDETYEYGYRHGRQVKHFLIDVVAQGSENLARVLGIGLSGLYGSLSDHMLATHAIEDTSPTRLILLGGPSWQAPGSPTDAKPFPSPLTCNETVDFVWDWLQRVEYPPANEHDGGGVKGWRAYNQQFGIVDDCWDAFIVVRPMWMYLPK